MEETQEEKEGNVEEDEEDEGVHEVPLPRKVLIFCIATAILPRKCMSNTNKFFANTMFGNIHNERCKASGRWTVSTGYSRSLKDSKGTNKVQYPQQSLLLSTRCKKSRKFTDRQKIKRG